MTTPEGKIEKHLKKEVEASGGRVRKVKWIGKSGAPDRLMWWPARPFPRMALVELKAPGKKPTKVQEIEHTTLRDDGFQVFVVDSVVAANMAITQVRDGKAKIGLPMAPIQTIDSPARHYDVKTPDSIPAMDNSDLA